MGTVAIADSFDGSEDRTSVVIEKGKAADER